MNKIYEPLFTPWKIRGVEIKNRIVLCSPASRRSGTSSADSGFTRRKAHSES